ncbi:MAG: HAD family hydrolase [Planctomycetota bacterium]
MRYDAAMFDLDGTLLDTLADLAAAGNHALQALGRPTFAIEDYRTLVGQGVHQLFVDALGPDHRDLVDQAVDRFTGYYAEHRFDRTAPYAGIDPMLESLERSGNRLAVLSNKPHEATVDVVGRYFPGVAWAVVRGHKHGTAPKPDPTSARATLTALGVEPGRCMYIGDTRVDMLTGKSAGMYTVGVSWGFRSVEELKAHGADAIVDEPGQLLSLFQS